VKSKQPPGPPASRFDTVSVHIRNTLNATDTSEATSASLHSWPPDTDAPSDVLRSKSRLNGALVLI